MRFPGGQSDSEADPVAKEAGAKAPASLAPAGTTDGVASLYNSRTFKRWKGMKKAARGRISKEQGNASVRTDQSKGEGFPCRTRRMGLLCCGLDIRKRQTLPALLKSDCPQNKAAGTKSDACRLAPNVKIGVTWEPAHPRYRQCLTRSCSSARLPLLKRSSVPTR